MTDEITVTIKDSDGNTFSRDWQNTDDKRNAIRWTLESGDLPYILDISKLVEITIMKNKPVKNIDSKLEVAIDELQYAYNTGDDSKKDFYIKNAIRFINEAKDELNN